jgi:hypothetical protein
LKLNDLNKENMNYLDIKTYEDACKAMGTTPEQDLPYANPANAKQEALNGWAMMDTIAAAINDDPDFPDHSDGKWNKWTIVWNMNDTTSPLGFSFSNSVGWSASSDVGSRLEFFSKAKAEYAARQFQEVFAKFLKKAPAKPAAQQG